MGTTKTPVVRITRIDFIFDIKLRKEIIMDASKYKSIAVKIDTYKLAKPIAEARYMSMGSYIAFLVDKDAKNVKKRKTNGENNNESQR